MDWSHTIIEWVGVTLTNAIPIGLYIMANKRSAKKDAEERQDELRQKIDGVVIERKYFPLHKHGEKSGALTAEGINYPPNHET